MIPAVRRALRAVDRADAARRRRWSGLAIRFGGGLIALGSVLPWAYVPVAGLRLPLPGVVGWGALTLLLGVWLFRRAPWPVAGFAGLVSFVAAWTVQGHLPAAINRAMIGLEWRIQPMNNLLARFGINPLTIFDTGMPWSRLRGPGTAVVMAGGALAVAGALLAATAAYGIYRLGRCAACGHRDRYGRLTAFCVRCGAPMPQEKACATCHTLAQPGDRFCAVCGDQLMGYGYQGSDAGTQP